MSLLETTMLIVFSGLPGTGKTTIAKLLATNLNAAYLRIDTIEQAMRNSGVQEVGSCGYIVANGLALNNLCLGHSVVVDCVNPVSESRKSWGDVAICSGMPLLNIEVICSDELQHRRRVEQRQSDIPGLVPPTWQSVLEHEYEAWHPVPFTVDTAKLSADQAVKIIIKDCLYGINQLIPA